MSYENIVVLGSQWGDEGKGKIVDLLAKDADIVVRFQGGNNAGHTLIVNQQKTVLSLLPSGILHPHIRCLIGNGVVVTLNALMAEIKKIKAMGVNIENRLWISGSCPLVLPTHMAIDAAREASDLDNAIGTTKRGIGPAYEDKIARRGMRCSDLVDEKKFMAKLTPLVKYHNFILEHYYHQAPIHLQQVIESCLPLAAEIVPLLSDVSLLLADARKKGQRIIFEGAQGTMLDIDHGTYPFVTSSNTTAGAVATGAGFGPRNIDYVLGITKTYTTRVGKGPFPTELSDEVGKLLAERGKEFGSVTGRARRCGWLDIPALRRSAQINSLSGLCLTKLDILDPLERIAICTGYRYQGKTIEVSPAEADIFSHCEPIYEVLPGWKSDTYGMTQFSQLPANAKKYVERIAELAEVPVVMLSTGPEREQMIWLETF